MFRAVTKQSVRVSKQTETHLLSQACSGKLLGRLIHAAGQKRGRGQRRADSGHNTQTTQGGPSTLFFHLGHRAAPTGRPKVCLMRGQGRLPQAARPGRAAGTRPWMTSGGQGPEAQTAAERHPQPPGGRGKGRRRAVSEVGSAIQSSRCPHRSRSPTPCFSDDKSWREN